MTKRTDKELDDLSADVNTVLSARSAKGTVTPPLDPVTMRMKVDVDAGNLNAGVPARATLMSTDGGGSWLTLVAASGATADDAVAEALRQLDGALLDLRAQLS